MPIHLSWEDDARTIYRCTVSGKWTLKDFLESEKIFHRDMAAVSHSVITIVDLRGARLSSGTLIDAFDVIRLNPVPNAEILIAISNSRLWLRTFQTIQQLFRRILPNFMAGVHWVTSDKEAYQLIADYHAGKFPPAE